MELSKKRSKIKIIRKKRKPRARTKLEILLFVANAPGDKITKIEIRNYLEKFHIKSKDNLKLHLSDLIEEKLLFKDPSNKGKPNMYYLNSDFHTLQKLFNYFKERPKYFKEKSKGDDRERDFMKTKFFINYTKSKDFRDKLSLYLTKEIILGLLDYFATEKMYGYFANHVNSSASKNYSESINNLRSAIRNSYKYKAKYDDPFAIGVPYNYKLKKTDYSKLSHLIAILRHTNTDSLNMYLHKLLGEDPSIVFNFIEDKKDEITAIVQTSPTTANYLLNFGNLASQKKLKLIDVLSLYLMNYIENNPITSSEIASSPDLLKAKIGILIKNSYSIIYSLIASMFLNDYMIGNEINSNGATLSKIILSQWKDE